MAKFSQIVITKQTDRLPTNPVHEHLLLRILCTARRVPLVSPLLTEREFVRRSGAVAALRRANEMD